MDAFRVICGDHPVLNDTDGRLDVCAAIELDRRAPSCHLEIVQRICVDLRDLRFLSSDGSV
jgi:hypothetical protein